MRAASIGRRVLQGYLRQPYAWFLNQHSAAIGASILTEVNEVDPALHAAGDEAPRPGDGRGLPDRAARRGAAAGGLHARRSLIGGTYALIYFVRAQAPRPDGRPAQAGQPGEVQGRRRGDRRHQGREAARPRGRLPRALRAPGAARGRGHAAVGVAGEVPRNVLRAITLGGILFFVVVMLLQGDGDLAASLPILGLYAFAGLRLLPALQQIYLSLTQMRFAKPVLDKLHADMMQHLAPAEDAAAGPPPAGAAAARAAGAARRALRLSQRRARRARRARPRHPGPHHRRHRRRHRRGQDHGGRRDARPAAAAGGRAGRRRGPGDRRRGPRLAEVDRLRAPADLPHRRHGHRQHRLRRRAEGRSTWPRSSAPRGSPSCTTSSCASCPRATTPCSASAACGSRAASASASASPARSTTIPTCWCSTRRPPRSTTSPSGR